MNILQIRNATLETMYFGVIEAILNSKQYSQAWTRKYGTMARSGTALKGYLGDEVERYMVVQKTEHGFDLLDNKAKKYLRANGVTPDTWILPEGTATFLQMVRPENRDYYIAGPDGPAGYKTALNDANYKGVRQIAANSCAVYESKSFEVPGAPAPVDPLVREVSVGEYVTMIDTVADVVAPSEYKSHMRDIFVYDERRDDFSRVTLRNALKACCRFDDSGALWFPPGFRVKAEYDMDPFLTSDGRPVYAFGDMVTRYMPDEVVLKVAESVVNKFLAYEASGQERTDRIDMMAEVWTTSIEVPADAAAGGKLLDSFFAFVRQRLPSSRVFTNEYKPAWRSQPGGDATTDAKAGFFWNTIGVVSDQQLAQVDNYVTDEEFFTFVEAKAFILNGIGADDVISWDVIRAKFSELTSSQKTPTPSELALTADAVDKFVARLDALTNGTAAASQNIFRTVVTVLSILTNFRVAAADWLKNYSFVAHKIVLELGKAKDVTNLHARIKHYRDVVNTNVQTNETKLKGTTAEVADLLRLPAAAGGAADAPAPLPTRAHFPALFGAFDIPAVNAHFGAGGFDATPGPAKRARFGALLSRDDGVSRGGRGAPGFDSDEVDLEAERRKVPFASEEFAARYAAVRGDESHKVLVKSVMLTFLHTPITEDSLAKLIERDVYFPFEFVVFRPRITHQMATGVLLKAGSETAETLVGHADFQLTDDVVRKMHYGHFTLYSKTLVWKSDNIYLAENIVSTGYVGGNDVSFNTLESMYSRTGEERARSMYAALVPVSTRTTEDTVSTGLGYFNPLDITGRFAQNVPHLANLDQEIGNPGGLHYPGADFYANAWRMNNSSQKLEAEFVPLQVNAHNTLCFQGHQMTYNPASRAYDLTTLNTGHFGPRIYPGCGQVRSMKNSKYLQAVSYTSAFGATTHMTTLGV